MLTAASLAACAPGAVFAADPVLQTSAGVDYSTGHYGATQPTDTLIVPLTAKLVFGDWSFRALIPFARVKGPADITVLADEGAEIVDNPGEEQGETGPLPTRSGLSDVSLSAVRSFNQIAGTPAYFDATARVRLPTGNRHKGLGVGAVDYFLEGEIGGDWRQGGAYADLGRRFLGDLPGRPRRDGWQTSVGGWWNPTSKFQVGASLDWHAASTAGVAPYGIAGGYVAYRLTRSLKLQLYGGAGVTSASPEADVSLSLIFRPTGRRH
jgi:hypothetical protein